MTRIQLDAVGPAKPHGVSADHIPAYLILQLVTSAVTGFLFDGTGGLVEPAHVALVTVTTDFRAELLAGLIDIDLELTKVGTSSVRLSFAVGKGEVVCAKGSVVFAKVDPTRTHSTAFDADERAALERLLDS